MNSLTGPQWANVVLALLIAAAVGLAVGFRLGSGVRPADEQEGISGIIRAGLKVVDPLTVRVSRPAIHHIEEE